MKPSKGLRRSDVFRLKSALSVLSRLRANENARLLGSKAYYVPQAQTYLRTIVREIAVSK
jgi:hypothetical protein